MDLTQKIAQLQARLDALETARGKAFARTVDFNGMMQEFIRDNARIAHTLAQLGITPALLKDYQHAVTAYADVSMTTVHELIAELYPDQPKVEPMDATLEAAKIRVELDPTDERAKRSLAMFQSLKDNG